VGGIGALRGALAHQTGLPRAGECQIQEPVGAVALRDALVEVGRHAVVEAGIFQFHGQRILEIDAAADRLRACHGHLGSSIDLRNNSEHARRSCSRTGKHQDPRQSQDV